MTPIDFDGINTAALRNGRSFVESLLPGGKFRSLEYVVQNPCRNDRRPGSFSINYKSGRWKDFASGDGGADLISLVAYVRGIGQGDAARELADELGVPVSRSNGLAKPNGSHTMVITTKGRTRQKRRRSTHGAKKGRRRDRMKSAGMCIRATASRCASRSSRTTAALSIGIAFSPMASRSGGRQKSLTTTSPFPM